MKKGLPSSYEPLFYIWFFICLALGIVLWGFNLFNNLGYEYALVSALFISLGTGLIAARMPARIRDKKAPFPGALRPVFNLYLSTVKQGLLMALVMLAISLVTYFWGRQCNIMRGLGFFILMPVVSVFISAGVGLLGGLLTKTKKAALLLFIIIYISGLFLAFYDFYFTCGVNIYNPLFGYFPGAIYDEIIPVTLNFITYRMYNLAAWGALLSLICLLYDPAYISLNVKFIFKRKKSLVIFIILFAISLSAYLMAENLGYKTTRQKLAKSLSLTVESKELVLHFPVNANKDLVKNLADDAHFGLKSVEDFFGVKFSKQISIYFFKNSMQKFSLTGSRNTNIAKPWRNEIFVIMGDFPHDVLRHEIAHVVAGQFGSGPLKISGYWGGLLPRPGIVEGIAVAAGGTRSDLGVHGFSLAMKKLNILPSIKDILGIAFYNLSATAAYTAAGSFFKWFKNQYGRKALLAYYKNNNFKKSCGFSLDILEKKWLLSLENIQLTKRDIIKARHLFKRPAVIHKVCVHETARLRAKAGNLISTRDNEKAQKLLLTVAKLTGNTFMSSLNLLDAYLDAGWNEKAFTLAKKLLNHKAVTPQYKLYLREVSADLEFENNNQKINSLSDEYKNIALQAPDRAWIRRLLMKSHLLELGSFIALKAVNIFMVRPGVNAIKTAHAMLIISGLAKEFPDDRLVAYLLARQYFNVKDYEQALNLLSKAVKMNAANIHKAFLLEEKTLIAKADYFLKNYKRAKSGFDKICLDTKYKSGIRQIACDWSNRCKFMTQKPYSLDFKLSHL